MIRHGTAAVGILAALIVAPLRAEPAVTEKIEYYSVTGSTPVEVRANIDRFGPVSPVDNKHYAGLTVGHIWWHYNYRKTTQGCVMTSASLRVESTITMPQLVPSAGTPTALVRTFADYTDKLLAHERGHAKIRIDTARRIEDGLTRLPAEPSCEGLGKTANALGQRLLDEEKQLNLDYDAQTQHGRAQGAKFP